jgi:hypothetical protein
MYDVVDVVPQVVILCDVTSETALSTFIESEAIEAADETDVSHIFIAELLLVTKLCEGINDDTKQNVHDDDLDNNEETNV